MEITSQIAESIYRNYIKNYDKKGTKAYFFYLKDYLDNKLDSLRSSFPEQTTHTIAIKTLAENQVLKHIVARGFGLEAASFEEVLLAKKAGAENKNIIFDSPVKTHQEINYCHKNFKGITLNANCLEELERYPSGFNGNLGLRINPLEKSDAPGIFNLSGEDSKFGVPISQTNEIIEACIRFPEIVLLHFHIGSGIKNFSNNVNAIKKVKNLAVDINTARKNHGVNSQIKTIDIGGGINFGSDSDNFSLKSFVNQLRTIDGLFGNYSIITEYGSYIHAGNSFVISDIEYVVPRTHPVPSLAFIHVGADLFVRKVYSNLLINYPVHVIYQTTKRSNETKKYRIVGPLCFEGDVLFTEISLPKLTTRDKLMIMNTGANTMSLWSHHCNRNKPKFVFI